MIAEDDPETWKELDTLTRHASNLNSSPEARAVLALAGIRFLRTQQTDRELKEGRAIVKNSAGFSVATAKKGAFIDVDNPQDAVSAVFAQSAYATHRKQIERCMRFAAYEKRFNTLSECKRERMFKLLGRKDINTNIKHLLALFEHRDIAVLTEEELNFWLYLSQSNQEHVHERLTKLKNRKSKWRYEYNARYLHHGRWREAQLFVDPKFKGVRVSRSRNSKVCREIQPCELKFAYVV